MKLSMISVLKEINNIEIKDSVSAWHGSPYDFDKFDAEKMGSGEGSQGFGWGLYFTDLEDVAKYYATNQNMSVSKNDLIKEIADKILTNFGNRDYSKEEFERLKKMNDSELKNLLDTTFKNIEKKETEAKIKLDPVNLFHITKDVFENRKNIVITLINQLKRSNSTIYQVTIHKGKTSDQYDWLRWDIPIPFEQMKKIQKQFIIDGYNGRVKIKNGKIFKYIGGEEEISLGKDFYRALAGDRGFSEKTASLFLLRAGIDGIKFPAESQTSNTARGFNYVIFDPNAVTIEKKEKK